MSDRLFLTPLHGNNPLVQGMKYIQLFYVPEEFDERGDSQQRERSIHVSPFPRSMAFRFSFLYKCPGFSVSWWSCIVQDRGSGKRGVKSGFSPLYLTSCDSIVPGSGLWWSLGPAREGAENVIRAEGPLWPQGPSVLQPFDSQRCPKSWW